MKLRLQMQNIKGANEAITSSHDILQKKFQNLEAQYKKFRSNPISSSLKLKAVASVAKPSS